MSHRFRQLRDLARGLAIYARLHHHEHGTKAELAAYQDRQLKAVVRHAAAHSPFYGRLVEGIDLGGDFALTDLPVVDKRLMMENFDDWVTDPRLKLAEIERQIVTDPGEQYYLGEYRIVATAGSSGLRGIFVYDRAEWAVVIAAAFRWAEMFGTSPVELSYAKLASIIADKPTHATSRLGQSMNMGIRNLLTLDATMALDKLVAALNDYQPTLLMGYASLISLLAVEQIEGRLSIAPEMVATFSETLGESHVIRSQEAWGLTPFNHYGAAEAVMIAAECDAHKGLHQFADMSIVEIVDADNHPVPAGVPGHKILLTNLHKFVQPVIRYEITDLVTEAVTPCDCDRPFPLFERISGRSEEIIHVPGRDGRTVAISPILVANGMISIAEVTEYQYAFAGDAIALKVVPRAGAGKDALAERICAVLQAAFYQQGAAEVPIRVAFAERLERTGKTMGKLKVVEKALPA